MQGRVDTKSDTGIVRLSTRDWIYIITLVTGVMAFSFKMYLSLNEKITANTYEIQTMRYEWNIQAPAPAKWTVEKINDHEKRIAVMETELP